MLRCVGLCCIVLFALICVVLRCRVSVCCVCYGVEFVVYVGLVRPVVCVGCCAVVLCVWFGRVIVCVVLYWCVQLCRVVV